MASVTRTRGVRGEKSANRDIILDAARSLMVEEGYAAVSHRRVAAEAGLKPALVQYYFPTMDELFLGLHRREAGQSIDRQRAAAASDRPLRALWEFSIDTKSAALTIEFMALANHRKAIRAEIAAHVERSRSIQAEALARIELRYPELPPAVLSVLLVGARAVIMEAGLGITAGHEEARATVRGWIRIVEPAPDSV